MDASSDTTALMRYCPLCGSHIGRLLEDLRFAVFDGAPISGRCQLVSCSCCGFGFYDTPSTQADFDRYYEQNAYYCTATTTGTGGSGAMELERFEKLFERFAPSIPKRDPVIIDVGCAKGGLLKVLAHQGFTRLFGVDMVQDCISYVRNSLGVQAEVGSALCLPFPDIRADVMVYSHVVEHVLDLASLVTAAREKLADGGILYVEVPDASKYGIYTANPYQDLYLEHVNHFDKATLSALFHSGGFVTMSSGCYDLDVPAGSVPCVWAVFRKGDVAASRPDRVLERHLKGYVEWSRRHPANGRFARLAAGKVPLYLWGVSQYAMLSLGSSPLRDCNLRGFVDKDPSKRMRTLLGRPVESPEVIKDAGPHSAVLITAPGYEAPIADELRIMGYAGDILTASGATFGAER